MEWRTLMKPRVLIVEDAELQLRGVKNDLDAISIDRRRELGIDHFVSDLAGTADEAERFFNQSHGSPYDLLLLDLGIPRGKGDPERAENGQQLLITARRTGAAKEVIVISAFNEVSQVARTFRSGAVDFIAKPYTTKALQAQVTDCWKRLLSKESMQILGEERINYLAPHAEKGLENRFTICFSNLVRAVSQSAEDIEMHMRERYGLDRIKDSQEALFKYLKLHEDSVAQARREWVALQTSLLPQNEAPRIEILETLLMRIQQELLPCLIVKNVTLEPLDEGATQVLAFGDAVHAVLKEIIVGGIAVLPDYNETRNSIRVKIESADGQTRVSFTDQLPPLLTQDAKEINQGVLPHKLPLWFQHRPHQRFERAWGLSVAQDIAVRGGGRLEIKPLAHGNVVTYFVPLAH
jgi:response regulator of citrate/malate metabolism